MKPSIGRIVHVIADPKVNNGSDAAPAMITRVWSDNCVNLRVLHDGPAQVPGDIHRPEWMTSIPLYENREALESANAQMVISGGARPPLFGAFWPPRVEA